MPGQRRRKQREARTRERWAERHAPGAGHWERRFVTQDEAAWRAEVRRVGAQEPRLAPEDIRLDRLCGRGDHPTTYVLSVFVRPAAPSANPA
ncbi:hypothetical protein [Streptomyces sp. NPDC058486]|uniref:hypothetical protein n=1 Tax=unclassified Streptomyces TaxID=2593676 RepID=UPI00364B5CC8